MKLLVLPSHRLLFYHNKMLLTLLPESFQAEEYATFHSHHQQEKQNGDNLIATLHYKTISVYRSQHVRELAQRIFNGEEGKGDKIRPLVSEVLGKKLEVLDLYETFDSKNQLIRECILSDKFGDMYKLSIPQAPGQSVPPTYINSNLGIPKYIKHLTLHHENTRKEYLFLADQQNRIKIYNSLNPHELLSVWFMINMSSIECKILKKEKQGTEGTEGKERHAMVVLLVRFFNKVSLETAVKVHYFACTQERLERDEYPGVEVKGSGVNLEACKFYTMVKCRTEHGKGIVVLYLFENKIEYEVYIRDGEELKLAKAGHTAIEQGKWDYLYGIGTEQKGVVLLTYGADVEMPIDIKIGEKELLEGKQEGEVHEKRTFSMLEKQKVSLNKYEKILKLDLKI